MRKSELLSLEKHELVEIIEEIEKDKEHLTAVLHVLLNQKYDTAEYIDDIEGVEVS